MLIIIILAFYDTMVSALRIAVALYFIHLKYSYLCYFDCTDISLNIVQ